MCIKLVIETSLYYDARSQKHQIMPCSLTCSQQPAPKLREPYPRSVTLLLKTDLDAILQITRRYFERSLPLKIPNQIFDRISKVFLSFYMPYPSHILYVTLLIMYVW